MTEESEEDEVEVSASEEDEEEYPTFAGFDQEELNEKDEDVEIGELAAEKGVMLFLVPKADTRTLLLQCFAP